jgi:hypothetical protein
LEVMDARAADGDELGAGRRNCRSTLHSAFLPQLNHK